MRDILRGLLLPLAIVPVVVWVGYGHTLDASFAGGPAETPLGGALRAAAAWAFPMTDPHLAGGLCIAVLFGCAVSLFTRRLTGNTLCSVTAGALAVGNPGTAAVLRAHLALDQLTPVALVFLAMGLRRIPHSTHLGTPAITRREVASLACTGLAALAGVAAVFAAVGILIFDLAYSRLAPRHVVVRSGSIAVAHAVAGSLGFLVSPPGGSLLPPPQAFAVHVTWLPGNWFTSGVVNSGLIAACVFGIVALARRRLHARHVIDAAAASALWMGSMIVLAIVTEGRLGLSALPAMSAGVCFAVVTLLWRIAMASTQPQRLAIPDEMPIPSVPALRDPIRNAFFAARNDGARARATPRGLDVAGIQSLIEAAVSGAVESTLQSVRLAFRAPHPTEPTGTAEEVLWNRLLRSKGAPPPDEVARVDHRAFYEQHLAPEFPGTPRVVCIGQTPWELLSIIAAEHSGLVLVERSRAGAQRAHHDLAGKRVSVIRHDGCRLAAIADGSVDAFVCIEEASVRRPVEVVRLLEEIRRTLTAGGVAAIAFWDLGLPGVADAVVRRAHAVDGQDGWPLRPTTQTAMDALARAVGLDPIRTVPGVLPNVSLTWMRRGAS